MKKAYVSPVISQQNASGNVHPDAYAAPVFTVPAVVVAVGMAAAVWDVTVGVSLAAAGVVAYVTVGPSCGN